MALLAAPAGAEQQPVEDPVAEAPIRLGVVGLEPRIAVTNVGVDTNVFNSVENPQQDFTFTASPGLGLWLRTGRGLLSVSGRADLVYFNEFETERSVNGFGDAQYEYRFNRLRPFVSFAALNARERPGYEIDVRARRFEQTLRVGFDTRVASKSYLEIAGRRQDITYAGDEVFQGQALNEQLNRRLEAVDLTWRQRLTVLTTWVVRASGEQERFDLNETRNGDSVRGMTGFELGRLALIRGNAFVGYRRLVAADGGTLPEFSGVVADANVSYTAPSQTRLGVAVTRDIQYSYEDATPYYVQTGWTTTLTQRITGRWDVQLVGGRDRLAYQELAGLTDGRTDIVNRIGGGIGYQVGEDTRVSLDAQSVQRESDAAGRSYKGIRAGLSVTYGF